VFNGEQSFRMLKHDGKFSTLVGQLGADAAEKNVRSVDHRQNSE
jgi:hypothetical protein